MFGVLKKKKWRNVFFSDEAHGLL